MLTYNTAVTLNSHKGPKTKSWVVINTGCPHANQLGSEPYISFQSKIDCSSLKVGHSLP